jgi:phenylalanyl-tRNA synthetase beta chain
LPTIKVLKSDIGALAGEQYTLDELETALLIAKGEIKGYDQESDEIKIELNDTNRPDLWSAEGIARQLRSKRLGTGDRYRFYTTRPCAQTNRHRVIVDERLESIRPYISCFRVRGVQLTEELIGQVIECEDKLAENLGRKRAVAAIGLSRAAAMKFPIRYRAGDPDADAFVPLDMDRPLTLREILNEHPTGRQYGHIIESAQYYPFLTDSSGKVISMPPVINCRELGEVGPSDTDFFIDVTGTDQKVAMLAANIMAADFADRGGRIVPVTTVYPYSTPLGDEVPAPYDFSERCRVELPLVESTLGVELEMSEVRKLLLEMGHRRVKSVGRGRRTIEVQSQPFRMDLLHPVDVVEDVAISRGYDTFEPIMPERFTVGKSAPIEELCARVREIMVGAGFQESLSPVLSSREALVRKMRLEGAVGGELVEIDNVMSELYSILRNSLLPSLLNVESLSSKAAYPHRVFELGEVASVVGGGGPSTSPHASDSLSTSTSMRLAAYIAHPKAAFSELHSYLDALFYYLGVEYRLEPASFPSFLDGRAGAVIVGATAGDSAPAAPVPGGNSAAGGIGMIGEVHPEVLERWGITMPAVAFEISLSELALRHGF